MNSISTGPLLNLLCCEVGSLIRSNTVCNMAVHKAFCKFSDDSLDKSIVHREGKFISRLCVFQSELNTALSMVKETQCNQAATRWLAEHPGECCPIRNSVFAVADLVFSGGCSQVGFGK